MVGGNQLHMIWLKPNLEIFTVEVSEIPLPPNSPHGGDDDDNDDGDEIPLSQTNCELQIKDR